MNATSMLTGLSLGAAAMYFFDPEQGRRRRKLALDQAYSAMCDINEAADKTWRDLGNRATGTFAGLQSAVSSPDSSDRVVCERVRSKLGRYVSHPHAIEVSAQGGHVTLTGPILASEVQPLVSAVKSVAGVSSVDNQLDVHQTAGNISALQGGRRRTGEPLDLLQNNWSPTTRLMIGSLGGAFLVSSAGSRAPASLLLAMAGMGLLCSALLSRNLQPGGSQPQQRRSASATEQEMEEPIGILS